MHQLLRHIFITLLASLVLVAPLVFAEGEMSEGHRRAFAAARVKAEAGDVEAQCVVAKRYYSGYGVEKDLGMAVHWYRKAVAQGSSEGQLCLGVMYLRGEGLPRDYEQAIALIRQPAENGDPVSLYYLGRCYRDGLGVSKNLSEAYAYLNLAVALSPNLKDYRDELDDLEGKMSKDDVSAGQKRSKAIQKEIEARIERRKK